MNNIAFISGTHYNILSHAVVWDLNNYHSDSRESLEAELYYID